MFRREGKGTSAEIALSVAAHHFIVSQSSNFGFLLFAIVMVVKALTLFF